jgi:hypothetical protein
MLGIFSHTKTLFTLKIEKKKHNKNADATCPYVGHFSCSHLEFNHIQIKKEGNNKNEEETCRYDGCCYFSRADFIHISKKRKDTTKMLSIHAPTLGIFLLMCNFFFTSKKKERHNKKVEATCPYAGHFPFSHVEFNHIKINKEYRAKTQRRHAPMLGVFLAHPQSLITTQ